MDVDNYSNSTQDESLDGFDSPRLDPPLRAYVPTFQSEDGISGLAMPMPEANGQHVMVPGTHSNTHIFDVGTYMVNVIAYYFHTRGTEIVNEACMEQTDGCDWMPKILALPGEDCAEDDECTSSNCVDESCAYPPEFFGPPVED